MQKLIRISRFATSFQVDGKLFILCIFDCPAKFLPFQVAMMSRITLNLKKQASQAAEVTQLGSVATSRSVVFRRPAAELATVNDPSYYEEHGKGAFLEIGGPDAKSLPAVPVDTFGNPWGKPKLGPEVRSHLPV
jgi:hypothetical protein